MIKELGFFSAANRALKTVFTIWLVTMFSSSIYAQEENDPWAQPISSRSLSGEIASPADGSHVHRYFDVGGTVSGRYRNLWLVVRIGRLHWPKEPQLFPNDGRWQGGVNEGGWPPGGRFELLLVDVSSTVSNSFQSWLENGHRTGHYPGLTAGKLGDSKILARKTYHLITE